jgi:hypothetical protein
MRPSSRGPDPEGFGPEAPSARIFLDTRNVTRKREWQGYDVVSVALLDSQEAGKCAYSFVVTDYDKLVGAKMKMLCKETAKE